MPGDDFGKLGEDNQREGGWARPASGNRLKHKFSPRLAFPEKRSSGRGDLPPRRIGKGKYLGKGIKREERGTPFLGPVKRGGLQNEQ